MNWIKNKFVLRPARIPNKKTRATLSQNPEKNRNLRKKHYNYQVNHDIHHAYKGCISGKGGSQETREVQYEEQGNHKGHGQDLMKQEPGLS